MSRADLARLAAHPGLHGSHCRRCNYLFDAFDAPQPLSDAIMRMKTLRCPLCDKRDKLFLLMPHKYREMAEARVVAEECREAVRRVADKYIERR